MHITALERSGIASLDEGRRVYFDLVPGQNGKVSAEDLKMVR